MQLLKIETTAHGCVSMAHSPYHIMSLPPHCKHTLTTIKDKKCSMNLVHEQTTHSGMKK
jgi:hypothetical protein